MCVDIFMEQTVNCQTQLNLAQNLRMASNPYQNFSPPDQPSVPIAAALESSPPCVACIQNVQLYQSTVLENYVKLRNQNTRPFPTLEEFLKRLYGDVQSLCAATCKSMTVTNVSQTLNFALDVSCISSTATQLDFYNNLEANIFQKMVNDKDLLAGIVTAFSALAPFNGQTVNEQITRLLVEVKTTLQSSSSANLGQQMLVVQNMDIEGNTGILINNVSQNAAKAYMVKNVYNALQSVSVVNDTNFKAVQELIDKNASLKEIFASGGRLATTWIDSLSTVWQAVLIVAIVVTSLVFIAWLSLSAYQYSKAAKELERVKREGCPKPEVTAQTTPSPA